MKRSGFEKRLKLPIARRAMIPIANAPRTKTPTTAGLSLVFMSDWGLCRALDCPDGPACQKVYDLGIGRVGNDFGRPALGDDAMGLTVEHDDPVGDPVDRVHIVGD